MPILDPGIPPLSGYAPYEDGLKRGIFINDITGNPYIGEVRAADIMSPCVLSTFTLLGFNMTSCLPVYPL